jgi:chorismate synthase
VFDGLTTGTSIAVLIRNTDQRSSDYSEIRDKYRPGHADYTFDARYGFRDYRGGGRSSARETTARVAAGAVAKKLIAAEFGGRVLAYVKQVGPIVASIPHPESVTLDAVEFLPDGSPNFVRCPDHATVPAMVAIIDEVRRDLDSIGGIAEVVCTGIPAGLGDPVFDKLKADLGKALFSLPAVLGVEYGIGFGCAELRGSQNNDVFTTEPADASVQSRPGQLVDGRRVVTTENRHGGMLGGISSGMPIILRAAVKPTSSLARDQPTITSTGKPAVIRTKGRHDPCLLPRFIPMAEAMVALVLADHCAAIACRSPHQMTSLFCQFRRSLS